MNNNPYGEANIGLALDVIVIEPDINAKEYKQHNIASSDFIVQFPNHQSSKKSFYVTIQINGNNLKLGTMKMAVDSNGVCKFSQGHSLRPETSALEHLIVQKSIVPGRNLIRYILHQKKDGNDKLLGTAEAYLFLWNVHDQCIISDIDGTVTRSDVRGVIDSILTESYSHVHDGVCQLFHDMVEHGKSIQDAHAVDHHPTQRRGQVRMLYLSSRPMTLIHSTRKFLSSMTQSNANLPGSSKETKYHHDNVGSFGVKLPAGPIFLHTGNLSKVLVTELVYKSMHEFKADTLARQVVIPFIAAGKKERVFIAGFGNKKTDYLSYRMVGLESRDIYIINKKSILTSVRHEDDCDVPNEVSSGISSGIERSKSGTLLCFEEFDATSCNSCGVLSSVEMALDDSCEDETCTTSSVAMSSSAIAIYTDPRVIKENDAGIKSSVKFTGYSDPRLKKELFHRMYTC